MGEAVEHEADRGQGDHGFGDLGQRLVVLGQSAPSAEPAERPFDHPAARLHDKAGGACGAANNDQHQTRQIAGEPGRKLIVDAVGEHGPEPDVEWFQALQQVAQAIGILNVGRMYQDAEQQPSVSTATCLLRLFSRFAASQPRGPPLSVVLTLWVSMIAAVGLASRPAPSRSRTTKWWRILSHTPSRRKARI